MDIRTTFFTTANIVIVIHTLCCHAIFVQGACMPGAWHFHRRCSEWQREVCALTQARRPRDSSSLLCALLFLTECFRSTIYVRFSAHPRQHIHPVWVMFWRQASEWKRDLCAENIHFHPGPPCISRSSVLSLNVACKAKAWHLIPALLTDAWDTIFFVMKKAEVQGLEKPVW